MGFWYLYLFSASACGQAQNRMIQADKKAFESDLYHASLGIKEREMNNLVNYMTALGTQAALVAGFGVGMMGELPEGTNRWLALMYYMCVATCMGAQLYCVCNSTLTTVLAPTMGLTGPRGSMHVAVKGMYAERRVMWGMFFLGMLSFWAAITFYVWIIITDVLIAGFCTFILLFILGVTLRGGSRILSTFDFKNETEQLSAAEYLKHKQQSSS